MIDRLEAERAVVDALNGLDSVETVEARAKAEEDLAVTFDDGRRVLIELKASAHPGLAEVERWVRVAGETRPVPGGDVVCLVVADEIPEKARRALREAGWGYYDRRGHLVVPAPGRSLEAAVPAQARLRPIRGTPRLDSKGVLAVGLAHLMAPEGRTPGVREMAGAAELSPSTVSTARAALVEAGLLDSRYRPAVPDLFWELARAWRPQWHPVGRRPDPADRRLLALMPLGIEGPFLPGAGAGSPPPPDSPGLEAGGDGVALSGFVAAGAYNTTVVVGEHTPVDLYLADEATLRQAVHYLGRASMDERAAALAVAPSRLVTRIRRPSALGFPLAHEVVVALDLAQDRGRGHEFLASLDRWWMGSPHGR